MDAPGETAAQAQVGLATHIAEDPARVGDTPAVVTFMMRGSGIGYDGRFAASNFDLELGAGVRGGFAWDLGVLLGPGGWIGDRVGLGLTSGAGLGSVHQRIPFAFRVPVQLNVAVHPLSGLFFTVWGRTDWVVGKDNVRQSGSTSLPFADELRLGLDTWIGRTSTSFAVGVGYAELMGTRFATARIAIASADTPPSGGKEPPDPGGTDKNGAKPKAE